MLLKTETATNVNTLKAALRCRLKFQIQWTQVFLERPDMNMSKQGQADVRPCMHSYGTTKEEIMVGWTTDAYVAVNSIQLYSFHVFPARDPSRCELRKPPGESADGGYGLAAVRFPIAKE